MKTITHKSILMAGCALSLAACVTSSPSDGEVETEELGAAADALVTDCDYLNPGLFPPLPVPIDFDRELVIRDLSVVEDPCRTTMTPLGPCAPGTVGVWHFGQLMAQMAGNIPPAQFVADWLHTFEVPQIVNGLPVPPRLGVRPALIDPWLVASGCPAGAPIVGPGACPLDLKVAPFRLLAIVNRIDLSGPMSPYGGPSSGEGRFVFGVVDPAGNPLQATVILEYQLPTSMDVFGWGAQWHALSGLAMGSPAYLNQLQAVTDAFSMAGVQPGQPNNGSAIGQVRTNEIAFAAPWDLREFTLQNTGAGINNFSLLPDTTKQTPDNSTLGSADLDNWLVANEPAILNVSHVVPAQFPSMAPAMGGTSLSPFLWDHSVPGSIQPMTRHLFGFGTCNGCHTVETDTVFVHILPRPAGVMAGLSPFLSATTASGAGGLPAGFQSFLDPAGTGMVLDYNEPWRRVCESARIQNGSAVPFTKANGGH